MIKRIVKMTFREDAVETFVSEVFEHSKSHIRAFPGCLHMELLRSVKEPNVLFTLSHWENEAALESYRASGLFENTWAKTKVLFGGKPEAWTLSVVDLP